MPYVMIGDERVEIKDITPSGWDGLYTLEEHGSHRSWWIAASSEEATKAAAEYWKDMAYDDAEEFIIMVGPETAVHWAFGHGSVEDWMDNLDPAVEWGRYDGEEHEGLEFGLSEDEEDEDILPTGFTIGINEYAVAYRRD